MRLRGSRVYEVEGLGFRVLGIKYNASSSWVFDALELTTSFSNGPCFSETRIGFPMYAPRLGACNILAWGPQKVLNPKS